MEICEVVFPLLTNCDGSKPLPEIIFQVEAGRQENFTLIEVSLKRQIYIFWWDKVLPSLTVFLLDGSSI